MAKSKAKPPAPVVKVVRPKIDRAKRHLKRMAKKAVKVKRPRGVTRENRRRSIQGLPTVLAPAA